MKIRRSVSLFLIILFISQPILVRAESVAEAKSAQEQTPEERIELLRRGEILADGGHLKKGVWGHMEGVVQAPPGIVWKMFLQSNEWKGYKFPQMIDCRALSEEVADKAARLKKVEEFYKLLDERVFDPTEKQVKGSVWHNYAFQSYNVPWPVSDKWVVVHNTNDETQQAKETYRCTWERVAGNIRSLTGFIQMSPFQGDPYRTHLTYHVETDPGSIVPKFLLKLGVKRSLPQAMQVIRRESVRLYGRPVPILKAQ